MKLANIVGGVAEPSALDRGSSRLLQVSELGGKRRLEHMLAHN